MTHRHMCRAWSSVRRRLYVIPRLTFPHASPTRFQLRWRWRRRCAAWRLARNAVGGDSAICRAGAMRIKPPALQRASLVPLPATDSRALIERARAIMTPLSRSAPASLPIVQFTLTCTRLGTTSLAQAEDRQGDLILKKVEAMPIGRRDNAPPASVAGVFRSLIFPDGFRCPGCRREVSGHTWVCDCASFGGSVHTCGENNRPGFCFCGKSEARIFDEGAAAEVRGAVVASPASLPALKSTARAAPVLPSPPRLLLPGKS